MPWLVLKRLDRTPQMLARAFPKVMNRKMNVYVCNEIEDDEILNDKQC